MDWIGTLSVAFTALMVLGTFLAIRQTVKSEKARRRVEWIRDFRQAAADMAMAVDKTMADQIAQDMVFGRFREAVAKGIEVEKSVKRSSFVLTSVLREYDAVFNECCAGDFMDKINDRVSPFSNVVGELNQFANLCKCLKDKADMGQLADGVASVTEMKTKMEREGFGLIVGFIRGIDVTADIAAAIHDTVVKLQVKLSKLDTEGLEHVLLRIGTMSGKKAYGNNG